MTRRPSDERGFTLLEMLAVMAILAIVMGLSVGAFRRLGRGDSVESSARILRSALARARASAIETGAPAQLRIVAGEPPAVEITEHEVAASLGFESEKGGKTLAGANRLAELSGAERIEEGWIGAGVAVGGNRRVLLPDSVALDPTGGFVFEARMRLVDDEGGGIVAQFGEALLLELSSDGSARLVLLPEGDSDALVAATLPGCFAPERWMPVRASFDGLWAQLEIHGVVEARVQRTDELDAPVTQPWRLERIGQARFSLGGGPAVEMDEVRVLTPRTLEPNALPPGAFLAKGTADLVRFDARGHLDPTRHDPISLEADDGVVTLGIEDEGQTLRLIVTPTGVVR